MNSNDLRRLEEELPQVEDPALGGVVHKLDMGVLPFCVCFFMLDAMNKSSITNARVAGLQTSLGLSNYQFIVALTTSDISFIIAQFPAALLMKHVGLDTFLPVTVILCGIVAGSQALVNNYNQLLVCRFLLGLAQGGIIPGTILYLSFFYPRKILHLRLIAFRASSWTAITNLLATAIGRMNGKGGICGWAWIFIMGMLTFFIGVISIFLLPRSPGTVCFLNKEERTRVVSALKHVSSVSEDDEQDSFRWSEAVATTKTLHVWLLALVFFFGSATLSGLTLFGTNIFAGLGYTDEQVPLMSVPPSAIASVPIIISAIISDRYQCRGYASICLTLLQLIGFTMYYASKSRHVRYASLFLSIAGANGLLPSLITWLANNTMPYTRRATGMNVCFILSEMGVILSTWLLGVVSSSPDFATAMFTFIVMSVGALVCLTANLAYLSRENRLKAEKRRRMSNEPKDLGDRSAWFVYSL